MTRHDEGSALVEFTFLGVLLLVPLTYVLLTALAVQRAAYAVTAAAREAGRSYVSATDGAAATHRARAAAAVAAHDAGLPEFAVAVACEADPCLTPGASVGVTVTASVALPFVPDVLGRAPARVAVHGRHVEVVDRFAVPR